MHSYVIIAADEAARMREIQTRTRSLGVSPFDVVVPEENASSIGIAEIRAFIQKLSLLPQHGMLSAGVIARAQLLTLQAQQALLKTLEEPPGHTILLLGVQNSAQLLPTVLSRCQIIMPATNAVPIDKKGLSRVSEYINVLISSSLGKRLSLIDTFGKTREEYETWINRALAALRQDMLQKTPSSSQHDTLLQPKIVLLHELLRAKRYEGNNVNTLLFLEHVLLRLGKHNMRSYG